MSQKVFDQCGLSGGSIKRVRGQSSATPQRKRGSARRLLNHMESAGFSAEWEEAAQRHRHGDTVTALNEPVDVMALKVGARNAAGGCL